MEEHLGLATEGATFWWSGRVPVTALATKQEVLIMLEMVEPAVFAWELPELDLLRFISWLALGIPGNMTVSRQAWLRRQDNGCI